MQKMDLAQFKNQIVGWEMVAPDQLLANPRNFRVHSKAQKDAMRATLRTVGWMDAVIVNKRTQNIINGHMRVQIALEDNEPEVPVLYVDVDQETENLALATFDNVGLMAGTDRDLLNDLLDETYTTDPILKDFLTSLQPGSIPESDDPIQDTANEDLGETQWMILVTCESEEEQVALLEQFEKEGLVCRALSTG